MTQAYSEELLSHLVELRGLQLATTWCDHVRWYEIDTTEDLQVQSDFSVERKVEACLEKGENSMLKYLWDPANAITTGGLLFSSLSLFLALSNRLELSIATALWAVLSDHLDGIVAAHTKHRHPDVAKMGKSLDGFADIMYGAVLPAVILIQLSGASVFALVAGTTLLAAGAIRLSYFANFGRLRDGRFFRGPTIIRHSCDGDHFPCSTVGSR